mmetsp:Transcript_2056/g.3004  ORF Transcript_2056/g.3004 Transcript_2056/m.3004 type:complete len:80 (-) Transcript_2056:114-353(-)
MPSVLVYEKWINSKSRRYYLGGGVRVDSLKERKTKGELQLNETDGMEYTTLNQYMNGMNNSLTKMQFGVCTMREPFSNS